MDLPGPSKSEILLADVKPYKQSESTSAFGFPEEDVINFINDSQMSQGDARDFMLFLTYSNHLLQATNGSANIDLECGTALITVINQLNGRKASCSRGAEGQANVQSENKQILPLLPLYNSTLSQTNDNLQECKRVFAKHNDAKFYPNIICVICKEWICSRNRRLHIAAHFGYRKYGCSACDFSHTKEIFVETHIRKCHKRMGFVLQKEDPAVERRIEDVCNGSISMTKDFLNGQYNEKTYASYVNICTDRSQIENKERRSRTRVLSAVTEASNRQKL
ncbi:unnamed protein product [Cylicocyclus nassatus]|uniref:C2H2-type domain-containing protein n=1 Tax=Cylicocyclus nassatus TaxID=53992 RepID=A0AA36H658_CYLNA|nr:unnamed protein product [Cylicocyclus nassatus]